MVEKQKKNGKSEIISEVVELARQGNNASKIGKQLGIHRTTVKRYLEQGEKRLVGREARIRVIQEALSKHFDDLIQVCQKFQNWRKADSPDKIIFENFNAPEMTTVIFSGERGRGGMILKVGQGKVEIDYLPVEREILFAYLKQHTKKQQLWPLFEEWKSYSGKYMSSLSSFYQNVKGQAIKQTGMPISDSEDKIGVSSYFAYSIYTDACDHAFFKYRGLEGVDYSITSPRADWYQLRFGQFSLASAENKEQLERCQEIHSKMIKDFRDARNQPQELINGISMWHRVTELESAISLELQKLMLKRSFHGQCELCPD
ncbi:MAG TPA: helix-turn-helix domain-containing protein [Dehalococcoidales bacterium]